ncbi:hypothetical protein H5410_003388 [Solanum commersonii]|uniref:Uncharacterized protein n=1 Tax=Solanum commersonii TaxID=4109 RepID=A0A9J6B5I3_SOLCO|nr:hypothetical protein H5410_003388 [Solanum commersonii]
METSKTLGEFRVGSVPTVFYIPDFITESEHDHLLKTIYDGPISKWKSLTNRRLQSWDGNTNKRRTHLVLWQVVTGDNISGGFGSVESEDAE